MVVGGKGDEMHVTCTSPDAAENYRKTGKFMDGSVPVKEVSGTDHAQVTTGDAHLASGSTKVRDAVRREPTSKSLQGRP